MTQKIAFSQLREQAIALRRAGRSRREIKELLGITSNETLNESLKGEPPQPWTWRPNAKDDLRARARQLREQGLDYEQIAAELGVSKSSVSLWVRDLECRRRAAEGVRRYWAAERPIREAGRAAVRADVEAAHRFWLGMTGLEPAQFRRPTLKRHRPTTVRKNTGDAYHGCLRIEVMRSTGLYRKIEGWAAAAMAAEDRAPADLGHDSN